MLLFSATVFFFSNNISILFVCLKLHECRWVGGSDGKRICLAMQETGVPFLGKLRRSPGERNGYPLQYSCLENSMDRVAWCFIVHEITESWT